MEPDDDERGGGLGLGLSLTNGPASGNVVVVRVYEDPGREAGDHRVLVDRLWPRGVKKEALDLDEWVKALAPTTDLRRWYAHASERFPEFAKRYRAELAEPAAAGEVERLQELARTDRLLLLTATRDVERSGAAVLQSVLENHLG